MSNVYGPYIKRIYAQLEKSEEKALLEGQYAADEYDPSSRKVEKQWLRYVEENHKEEERHRQQENTGKHRQEEMIFRRKAIIDKIKRGEGGLSP